MGTYRRLVLLSMTAAFGCTAPAAVEPSSVRPHFDLEGVEASATGSAHIITAGELRSQTFTAVRRADGTVEGEFTINIIALGVRWHTRIECLTVVGNRALFGGTITDSSDPRVVVGTKSYFWVEDRGEGEEASPDLVSVTGFNETQQGLDDFCGLVQNLLPPRTVVHGNVQVRG